MGEEVQFILELSSVTLIANCPLWVQESHILLESWYWQIIQTVTLDAVGAYHPELFNMVPFVYCPKIGQVVLYLVKTFVLRPYAVSSYFAHIIVQSFLVGEKIGLNFNVWYCEQLWQIYGEFSDSVGKVNLMSPLHFQLEYWCEVLI